MERDRWMAALNQNEKNELLDAQQYNLRLSGENDNPVRLNKLKLYPDFVLKRAYDEQLWRVVRMFGNGQVLVKHEAAHEGDQDHIQIWGKHRLVRIPEGII